MPIAVGAPAGAGMGTEAYWLPGGLCTDILQGIENLIFILAPFLAGQDEYLSFELDDHLFDKFQFVPRGRAINVGYRAQGFYQQVIRVGRFEAAQTLDEADLGLGQILLLLVGEAHFRGESPQNLLFPRVEIVIQLGEVNGEKQDRF